MSPLWRYSIIGLTWAAAVSCGGSKASSTGPDKAAQYNLVWADDFDGPAGQLPDSANWKFDSGGHGWGNNQQEYNTNRPENASLDGKGNLAIVARAERFENNDYTSARIKTQGLFKQTYGRFEARVSLPKGQGIWSAFWLLGNNFDRVGWPSCGEIDIMEYRGQHPAVTSGTIHGPGYSGSNGIGTTTAIAGGIAGKFRLFAVEWEPERIRWFVDDFNYHTVIPADLPTGARWVYNQPFFIILNVAVGGWFPGNPDATTSFPQTMLVDYVRVYETSKD